MRVRGRKRNEFVNTSVAIVRRRGGDGGGGGGEGGGDGNYRVLAVFPAIFVLFGRG